MNLEKIFSPSTVAVIGASVHEGTIGSNLVKNLVEGKFHGEIYPVNPLHKSVMGIPCFASIKETPKKVDLAVVAVPAKTVPQTARECGEAGIKGMVIISSGFSETGEKGKKLENELRQVIQKFGISVIGPNCLGIINPRINLNASFAIKSPSVGKIAMISQSGALCSSIIDWSLTKKIGFSYFVSLGGSIDVDFSDLIEFFSKDKETSAIAIYMESLKKPLEFIEAASKFCASSKPIFAIKSGKEKEGMKAASSHTGALAGNDAVYNAAFTRAGIVRVNRIDDLFDTIQFASRQPLPKGNRLAIITNAGGPGVIATDYTVRHGIKLAELKKSTLTELNKKLPSIWSKANPVDVLGDANPKRYGDAITACVKDSGVDAILTIFTPQGVSDGIGTAKVIVAQTRRTNKPIMTCWIGMQNVNEARDYCNENNIPNFRAPERALKVFSNMHEFTQSLKEPFNASINYAVDKKKAHLRKIVQEKKSFGLMHLNEFESKKLLNEYGINCNKTLLAKNVEEVISSVKKIGFPVVMKISSPQIMHKTEAKGVVLGINSIEEARKAFHEIMKNAHEFNSKAEIEGVTVQPMVRLKGIELIVGSKIDSLFGPVLLFGAGGTMAEFYRDSFIGIPPLDAKMAKKVIKKTKIYRILRDGFRDIPKANMKKLIHLLMNFSRLIIDFPEIKEIDLNPVIANPKQAVVVDARIILH